MRFYVILLNCNTVFENLRTLLCVLVCFVRYSHLALEYMAIFIKTGGVSCRGVTHKNSVITFCMRKLKKAERDPEVFDRESVILLWKLLILLLRQNGVSSSRRNTTMCIAFCSFVTI